MSTRGFYVFKQGNEVFNVYKHCDNYPDGEHGGFAAIGRACRLAWTLPRFEADEFAASFVAVNKTGDGDVRLCPSGAWQDIAAGDIEYVYVIEATPHHMAAQVSVTCFDVSNDYRTNKWTVEQIHVRPLEDVAAGWFPQAAAT